MKAPKFSLKNLLLICLGAFLSITFTCGFNFNPKEWKKDVYNNIERQATAQLTALFDREVSVESTSGLVLGEIILNNVKIAKEKKLSSGTAVSAKKIILKFNPLKYLSHGGNILPALYEIILVEARADVIRDKNDNWNVANFLPPPDKKGAKSAPPLPFKGKIIIKDCEATFTDQKGWGTASFKKPFRAKLRHLGGEISLKRNSIVIRVSCDVFNRGRFVPTVVKGNYNLKNNKYRFDIRADDLKVKGWESYVLPIPNFKALGGSVSIKNLTVSGPAEKAPYFTVDSLMELNNVSAQILDYELTRANGKLKLKEDEVSFVDLAAYYKGQKGVLNGRIYNFSKPKADLSVESQNFNFGHAKDFVKPLANIDLSGSGYLKVRAKGPLSSPGLTATIITSQSKLYGKKIKGAVFVTFKNKLATLNFKKIYAYGGAFRGKSVIDLSYPTPQIKTELSLDEVDLSALANEAPGIEGKADGSIILEGHLGNLKGSLSLSLNKALLYGQPVNQAKASFTGKDGNVFLEEFSVRADKGAFRANGIIYKDLTFDLTARSRGLQIQGKGFLGKMSAGIKNFEGKINFTLNEQFLKNPLKHLNAEGEIEIEKAALGKQTIDEASGIIIIGNNLIHIAKGKIRTDKTILEVEGQTGIGIDSDLRVKGKNCQLEKLQILSYFIPGHIYSKLEGLCDIELRLKGTLPKETKFTSFAPLLLLDAQANIKIKNAALEEVKILPSSLKVEYKDKRLNLEELKLITLTTNITARGKLDADSSLDFHIQGKLDLKDLAPLLPPDERLEGQSEIETTIKGPLSNPAIGTSFSINNLKWNIFKLANLRGKIRWKENRLLLAEPLTAQSEDDHYLLSGKIDFRQTEKLTKLEDSIFDLSLKIKDSQLDNFLNLAELIRAEVQTRLALARRLPSLRVKLDLKSLLLPVLEKFKQNSTLVLYKSNGNKKGECFLEVFKKETEEVKKSKKELQVSPIENVSGKLEGRITLKGKSSNLQGGLDLKIKEGRYRTYLFEELSGKASLRGKTLTLEKATLKKGGGELKARGTLGFGKNLSFSFRARELPTDILKILFPEEETFGGNFNLSGSIEGTLKNPVIAARFNSQGINLAGTHFDQTQGAIELTSKKLVFKKLELRNGDKRSKINGQIPLSLEKGEFDLTAELEGSALGLVNIFTNAVHYEKGQCRAFFSLKGPVSLPRIQGKIKIKDSSIKLPLLGQAKIENINCLLVIENGVVALKDFSSRWRGKNTKNEPNRISLQGNLDLKPIFSSQREIDLDLKLKNTDLIFEWINLYSGEILLKNISLYGPLPLSGAALKKRGPTLTGSITLNEGNIYLPKGSPKKNKNIYFNYRLSLNLDKDIYITAGNPGSIDPRNVLLNLAARGENLKVSGSSEEPVIRGKVNFTEGSLSILSRDFTLLGTSDQEKYYPYDRNKIEENTAIFKSLEDQEGVIPNLNLTALAEVVNYKEPSQSNTDDEDETAGATIYEKEDVLVVSRIKGMPFVKDEDRGIKVNFEAFKEDTTKKPSQISPVSYSQQEIKVLLLPDFLKGALGLSKGKLDPDETAGILDDYINNYIRARFVRKIERELENSLGLESLTLEYNFGKALRKNLTGSSVSTRRDASKFGIGAVKGFFDRFYISAKYSQLIGGGEGTQRSQLFNYELIYKLSKMWSISYYQEPDNMAELTTGYYKITLKGGYYF